MRAIELMSRNPATCTPDTSLERAAHLMEAHDCGCLPVVDNGSGRILGVITDRDIATRAVGHGKLPQSHVGDIMSAEPSCCHPVDDVETVQRIMVERQVRRVPVVDDDGICVGIIAQADLALHDLPDKDVARTVERISEPSPEARREMMIGMQPG
jgi:CBS domain-containing protein